MYKNRYKRSSYTWFSPYALTFEVHAIRAENTVCAQVEQYGP